MGWSLIVLLIVAACLIIYLLIEFKKMKHKLLAIFLIALILFAYGSGVYVFKGKKIDWKSPSGIMSASNIYLSWLGHAFGNAKSITANVVKMDWQGNQTSVPPKKK